MVTKRLLVAVALLVSFPALASPYVMGVRRGDTTAPEAISDLAVGSPTSSTCPLTWTSPHEDGASGGACASYDIRYCTDAACGAAMDDGEYGTASTVTAEPTPSTAGSAQSPAYTITGLAASTTYRIGIKSIDDGPNTSALSNSASCTTSAGAGSPDLLDETFNNATDYDDAGWTPTTADGGSVDPNTADATCPNGTGWSGECMSTSAPAFGKGYSTNDTGTSNVLTFMRVRLYIDDEGWEDTEGGYILGATTDGDPFGFQPPALVRLQKVGAQLQLRLDVKNSTNLDTIDIATDTLYCLEIKVDDNVTAGVGWEWRLGGVSQGSGGNDPGSTRYWSYGFINSADGDGTFMIRWEDVEISSNGYPGCS